MLTDGGYYKKHAVMLQINLPDTWSKP